MNGKSDTTTTRAAGATIRLARSEDLADVMNTFDGALLDVGAERVRERIEAGEVFLASEEGRVRGAIVLSELGVENRASGIEAIAVRRRHRNRAIASALIERARREGERALIAEFDERVRPFYESVGFRVEPIGDDRFRGRDGGNAGRERGRSGRERGRPDRTKGIRRVVRRGRGRRPVAPRPVIRSRLRHRLAVWVRFRSGAGVSTIRLRAES